jgi:ubiquitin-like 1-activating enzyme E1 A
MSALSKEDEALYDRQIRLWGREAQQKIKKGTVLIGGLFTGVTHEIIKNLVLKGIGEISLLTWQTEFPFDTAPLLFPPSGPPTNTNVAETIVSQATLMNPTVKLSHRHLDTLENLSQILTGHSMFILVNETSLTRIFSIDAECRAMSVPFQYLLGLGFESLLINALSKEHEYISEVKRVVDGEQITESKQEKIAFCTMKEIWDTHLNTQKPSGKIRKALPGKYSERFKELQEIMVKGENVPISDQAAVNSIIGAISAQEVVKVVTGKDLPLHNVVLFDGRDLESTVLSLP